MAAKEFHFTMDDDCDTSTACKVVYVATCKCKILEGENESKLHALDDKEVAQNLIFKKTGCANIHNVKYDKINDAKYSLNEQFEVCASRMKNRTQRLMPEKNPYQCRSTRIPKFGISLRQTDNKGTSPCVVDEAGCCLYLYASGTWYLCDVRAVALETRSIQAF
jgi:phosphatidate phosphatase PAH1